MDSLIDFLRLAKKIDASAIIKKEDVPKVIEALEKDKMITYLLKRIKELPPYKIFTRDIVIYMMENLNNYKGKEGEQR